MTMITLKRTLALLASAVLLTACGGEDGDDTPDAGSANESQRQSLMYAYPDDGQSEVATRAPIVLRFSSGVSADRAEQHITLTRAEDGQGIAFSAEKVPGESRGIVLNPVDRLEPNTEYEIDIQGLNLARGTSADRELTFTTRADQRGPKSLVISDDAFELSRAFPDGGEQEPVMDFSTFRFQFTQPVFVKSARYGGGEDDTISLTDENGDLVEAALVVDGPYMTIDPVDPHLDTSQEYTLTLGELQSQYYSEDQDADEQEQHTFGGQAFTFTPQDSSPRGEPTIMVQRITDSDNRQNTSALTGKPVNEVPVNGTLLGEDAHQTQASGDVRAELADVTRFTDVTPVRIPKETVLTGSNIDVLIGGEVPGGISSGAVKMHFLSDATGYLVPNPYSDTRDDALRLVKLFMDVGIATENPEANGSFTQDMLHIELIGLAEVDPQEGVLNIDAVSLVEPDVLGQEFASGMLSFQLQSYQDQTNPPDALEDTTAPRLQSWMPGDNVEKAKAGDPIVLNFDEPLDQASLQGRVHLTKNEGGVSEEQEIDYYMDGAALVIEPLRSLRNSEELNEISYNLSLDSGITDPAGNELATVFDETIELPLKVQQHYAVDHTNDEREDDEPTDVATRSPMILGLYPGFPCALDENTTDLENDIAGRCKGSIPEDQEQAEKVPLDDLLPVNNVPGDRPIMVSFSKRLNPDSVALGQTFQVHRVDAQGNEEATINGKMELKDNLLTFYPNQPWEEDDLYRYTLSSNGDIASSDAECDATLDGASICGEEGFPLQTQLLSNLEALIENPNPGSIGNNFDYSWWVEQDNESAYDAVEPTGGGPDLTQFFRGAEENDDVLQMLRTAENNDTNANLFLDRDRRLLTEEDRNGFAWPFVDLYEHDVEEQGPSQTPDENTSGLTDSYTGYELDPGGVKPAPNSAKILSRQFGMDSLEDSPEGMPETSDDWSNPLVGGNVGCGFQEYRESEDQTNCDIVGGFFDPTCYTGVPAECPEEKFTYLNSTLFGEVTRDYDPENGLKVRLFPGHVLTTQFNTVLKRGMGDSADLGISGFQVMRMRYEQGNNDRRDQPITGFIRPDQNGDPVFNAEVDLYLNAPRLAYELDNIVTGISHNFYSYQISMALSGPVTFLEDGRMVIEQYNIDPVDFSLRGHSPKLYMDLFIPEKGSYLKYISQPIK